MHVLEVYSPSINIRDALYPETIRLNLNPRVWGWGRLVGEGLFCFGGGIFACWLESTVKSKVLKLYPSECVYWLFSITSTFLKNYHYTPQLF